MAKDKAAKVKPIGDISAVIMRLALNYMEGQVEKKVGDPDVLDGVKLAFPLSKEVIEVLNDDNPNNREQVREALFTHLNGPVADFLDRILGDKIVGVVGPDLEAVLLFIKEKAISALRIVTDDNEENKVQLDAFWDTTLADPEFHALVIDRIVVPLAVKAGAKEAEISLIKDVLDAILKGLLGGKKEDLIAQIENV